MHFWESGEENDNIRIPGLLPSGSFIKDWIKKLFLEINSKTRHRIRSVIEKELIEDCMEVQRLLLKRFYEKLL